MALTLNGSSNTITPVSAVQPAGSILQVVTGTTTTEAYKSGNTTYGDTGLTASITPASGTKIVVIINQPWYTGRNNSEGEASIWIKTLRDSTMLQETKLGYTMMARAWQEIWSHFSFTYLDTHGADGSTAVVYKTQYKAGNGDTEAYVQRDSAGETNRSNIVLMEVAG